MVYFNLLIIKSFNKFFWNIPSIHLFSPLLLETLRYFKASVCFSVCFSKAFPKGDYVNLACSIICF